MRVIHVAGTSGSGKTTFIRDLLPLVAEYGPTAVVKHLGHHRYTIEPGKDTTVFYEGGAIASVGIDSEKTVAVIRQHALGPILSFLSSAGTRFLVVEGWKTLPLPKIVIGTLPGATGVVMENPSPAEVIPSLGRFPCYCTLEGLTREIGGAGEQGVILAGRYPVKAHGNRPGRRREFYHRFSPIQKEIEEDAASLEGVSRVSLCLHEGLFFGEGDALLVAVRAKTPRAAMHATAVIQQRIQNLDDSRAQPA